MRLNANIELDLWEKPLRDVEWCVLSTRGGKREGVSPDPEDLLQERDCHTTLWVPGLLPLPCTPTPDSSMPPADPCLFI